MHRRRFLVGSSLGVIPLLVPPGTEPAVVLITGLVAADQPFLIPVDMDMATPAA